ncbi:MAG: PleD family two-component system response regulator [Alphaproteobacteria bacterium]|nr:PleD family two-component system response regulator [Alphaproteobacteria bacterium]
MSARILVVDDNPLNLKLLNAKLLHDYYVVSSAENGTEALEKIEKEKPDIVLLDVMMPDLDGFETCKRIKTNPATAHIPVIMVTALSDVADRVKGLESGADDFLTKPINDLALMARVRSLLRLKMIMDEWRLRETTSSQLAAKGLPEDNRPDIPVGGHVLLLEDNPVQQSLILETLQKVSVHVSFAKTVAEAAVTARSGAYDLALVSLDLRNEDGLLLCSLLRAQEPTRQLPILLLANEEDIQRVARGLDLGANDYLMRPLDANEILARTRTQLRQKKHYERMRQNYEENFALALIDPLTGAFNRRYLDAHLPRLLTRSITSRKPLSVIMTDIDHFKQVNDKHGHAVGDAVLRETVNRMINGLRPSDLVVRMGGEEFAIILPETDHTAAMAVSERVRGRIAKTPIPAGNGTPPLPITVSIGVATLHDGQNETSDMLLKRADMSLLKAKQAGRNKVVGEE